MTSEVIECQLWWLFYIVERLRDLLLLFILDFETYWPWLTFLSTTFVLVYLYLLVTHYMFILYITLFEIWCNMFTANRVNPGQLTHQNISGLLTHQNIPGQLIHQNISGQLTHQNIPGQLTHQNIAWFIFSSYLY